MVRMEDHHCLILEPELLWNSGGGGGGSSEHRRRRRRRRRRWRQRLKPHLPTTGGGDLAHFKDGEGLADRVIHQGNRRVVRSPNYRRELRLQRAFGQTLF